MILARRRTFPTLRTFVSSVFGISHVARFFFGALNSNNLNSNKWCIDIVSLRPDDTGGNL